MLQELFTKRPQQKASMGKLSFVWRKLQDIRYKNLMLNGFEPKNEAEIVYKNNLAKNNLG